MEVENISLENLRIQHAHLDAVIKEEESHIWKNCIKIEELKKQKLRKKDEMLRRIMQTAEAKPNANFLETASRQRAAVF